MEAALEADYFSVLSATKKMNRELGEEISKHTEIEHLSCLPEGSLFKRHRETISRHASALNVTIGKCWATR